MVPSMPSWVAGPGRRLAWQAVGLVHWAAWLRYALPWGFRRAVSVAVCSRCGLSVAAAFPRFTCQVERGTHGE